MTEVAGAEERAEGQIGLRWVGAGALLGCMNECQLSWRQVGAVLASRLVGSALQYSRMMPQTYVPSME